MFNYCRDGVLLVLAAFAVLFLVTVNCDGVRGPGKEVQWQILTKLNYSSQIRLHHHLLLLVSVPWSGESRSLMKELAHAVAIDEHKFGDLKLMFLNKKDEKMLADALGADDGLTFFYHRHSLSYKYSGRLRMQNILSSVHYAMSLTPDELPFKSLNTPDELQQFLKSSDKAVILLEFCGWTQRLLAKLALAENKPGKDNIGDVHRMDNGAFTVEEKDDKKATEDSNLICSMDSGFNELNRSMFTFWNDTTDYGSTCTEYELNNFEVFLKKLVLLSRQLSLPPERHKFAVVREKSLLPLLNINETPRWLMVVHFAGCPSCFMLVEETENLHTVLQAQASPILELEDATLGIEATLHAEWPTMLLFVDRSSDSMKVRRESERALIYFREFAQETQMNSDIRKPRSMMPDSTTSKSNKASLNRFRHPRLNSSPLSQKILLTDKMSIMIMKDGKQVTLKNFAPHLQGSSVHEVLNYALKSNELKLSSIAKSAGFQLLSQDFDIELADGLPSKSEGQFNQLSRETPMESGISDRFEKQMLSNDASLQLEEQKSPSFVEPTILEGKDALVESIFLDSETKEGIKEREATEAGFPEINESKEEYFSMFFHFIDGNYRLLEALTGGLKVPSIVIIDPSSEKHYVLDEHLVLNRSLLSTFAKDFIIGQLPPFIQSGVSVHAPRAAQNPPFVNLDFHEKGSIPMVTSWTFSELVYGNTSDPKNSSNSWNKNVLVLFGNDWCGFCQRMELVVREVHRAIRVYKYAKKSASREGKWMRIDDSAEDTPSKLPLIYKMDCTINDCSFITQLEREIYPRLLLFPAGGKNDTISYEGDVSVCGILNFLAAHGCSVRDVIYKSVLHDLKTVNQVPRSQSFHHEVILKDVSHNAMPGHRQIVAKPPLASHERSHLYVGCILLATEKLLDVHPFDESRILLVKADESTGFQGLITNKPITWDSVELGQDLVLLKETPLFFGGPVVTPGMPLVALTNNSINGISVEVLPNIHFIDQFAIVSVLEEIRIGNRPLHDFWFFLGYSGWAWEQLFTEIERGDWNVSQEKLEPLGLP